jgi:hypothetical protein
MLTNARLAELLAREAEESGILIRAYRRAARSAFLWPQMAAILVEKNQPLTELKSVGPFMAKRIRKWIRQDVPVERPRALRWDFLTLADANFLFKKNPTLSERLRGDLQMHTRWSDGSGTIAQMKNAASPKELSISCRCLN